MVMHKVNQFILTCNASKDQHVILESTTATAKAAIELIDNIECLDANDRFLKLKAMVELLTETAQRNSEKAALAKVTSDAVNN